MVRSKVFVVLFAMLASCGQRPPVVGPSIPAPHSRAADPLLRNWNALAVAGNHWARLYSQGRNDLAAQRELEKAYERLRKTEGWSHE